MKDLIKRPRGILLITMVYIPWSHFTQNSHVFSSAAEISLNYRQFCLLGLGKKPSHICSSCLFYLHYIFWKVNVINLKDLYKSYCSKQLLMSPALYLQCIIACQLELNMLEDLTICIAHWKKSVNRERH